MSLTTELQTLSQLTVPELRQRYLLLFGEATTTGNRTWLIKRIAWRWQAQQSGGLSERARQRAQTLATLADLRRSAPPDVPLPEPPPVPRRLPQVGTVLIRVYKGERYTVEVLEQGFLYAGQVYKSLSAVAKQITGTHINGHQFFGLRKESRA